MIRCLLLCFLYCTIIQADLLKRKVLALYDSRFGKELNIAHTSIHISLEMPLNYLGIDVLYYDLKEGLPNLKYYTDCIGILTCFPIDMGMDDPKMYLRWAKNAIDQGFLYIIIGTFGYHKSNNDQYTPTHKINRLNEKIGFSIDDQWIDQAYNYEISYEDPELYPYEAPYPKILSSFPQIHITSDKTHALIVAQDTLNPTEQSNLVLISDTGAYIAEGFAASMLNPGSNTSKEELHWYINPFVFFKKALHLESLPVPDTTTLAGRRIFYSHIDGDSLNSVSEIEKHGLKRKICGEIIYEKLLKPFPQLPVTVGFVGADIDKKWVAIKPSLPVAKKTLALEHIECGSHTYSHPFLWQFFNTENVNDREKIYLYKYPYGSWDSSLLSWLRAAYHQHFSTLIIMETGELYGYIIPRAYANYPFDLNLEIEGSLDKVQSLAPKGKKAKVLQWSGDCAPWEQPLLLCKKAGVWNINGGTVRLDPEHPSRIGMSGIGKPVGNQRQIYTSADNENLYTFLWKDRFWGFQYVTETWDNTEYPLRLKPINLYYHYYSGEKLASLNALLHNVEYVLNHSLIPVWTSRYLEAANGFYSTKINALSNNRFEIQDRGGLQTIRFDAPYYTGSSVDYANSVGVIGHTFHVNHLYVYLDAHIENPIISLTKEDTSFPYLVQSNWEIYGLNYSDNTLSFSTWGFGDLEMLWDLPQGRYEITAYQENQIYSASLTVIKDALQWLPELKLKPQRKTSITLKKASL